jgi:multidrug efflux pump subunit AcrA (membrane-fusion protein)
VLSRAGQSVVFLVDGDRVVERPVRAGRRLDAMVEIVEGLGPGDKLVVNPGNDLKAGTRVKVPEK